jgi:putative hydrolase of the HAD superfamily
VGSPGSAPLSTAFCPAPNMTKVTALFCDIGGVLLTNAWGQESRRKAAEIYQLDWNEYEALHEPLLPPLEEGRISLDEYLDGTVFHRPRDFTKEEFRQFIFAQSQPYPETLEIFGRLERSNLYLLGSLNNESLELNLYRIERFRLRDFFAVFFSSCFLGLRKPGEAIYRKALQMTQRAPEEVLFIDDRAENVAGARRCGIRGIHYQHPDQLRRELRALDIEI